MSAQEIIASGKLELYVYGGLTPEERNEVEEAMATYPEVVREVEAIEAAVMSLSSNTAPQVPSRVWSSVRSKITGKDNGVRRLPGRNWAAISGWAAAILCIGGIFWLLNKSNALQQDYDTTVTENEELKEQVVSSENQLAEANELLEILRSKEYNTILLPGNAPVAPEAYAKVFYNPNGNIAYIDTTGLPEAPEGIVYQAWSLTLDPLTPTSMGVMDDSTLAAGGIFKFDDVPTPEAFGITLEPAGGSEQPNLEQLYTLGTVAP